MPEMPELEVLRLRFEPSLVGAMVTAAEVNPRKAHMLRYPVEDFERQLPVRRFRAIWRRGKHLGFDLELAGGGDLRRLVVNPMLGGRFEVVTGEGTPPATWVFGLRLEDGRSLRYLDFRDMGRIYWIVDPEREIPAWPELGPEADAIAAEDLETFRRRLRRFRDELKDLLRNQSFLAGVGNAYSDEILFEARLLPLRRRSSLTPEEEEALYWAIPEVLNRAIAAIQANPNYQESKQDRKFMCVHGKAGEACPRCGHRISQLGSAREPLNFCRGCQL